MTEAKHVPDVRVSTPWSPDDGWAQAAPAALVPPVAERWAAVRAAVAAGRYSSLKPIFVVT